MNPFDALEQELLKKRSANRTPEGGATSSGGTAEHGATSSSGTEHEKTDTKPKAPELPSGVWGGPFTDLDALDIPDPRIVATIAGIEVAEQEAVLVRGQANTYKTFLVLLSMLRVALAGGVVVLLSGEGGRGALRKRIRRLLAGMGLDAETLAAVMARIYVLHGSFGLVEYEALYRRTLEERKPVYVVVDPLIEYNAGDENSSQDMRRILGVISAAKQVGAAVVLVHHSTKPGADGKTSARGSSALRGFVDQEMVTDQGDNPTSIILTHEKNRERGKDAPRTVVWSFTDETITCEVLGVDVEKLESDATRRRVTKLLGLLAQGDVSLASARAQCGNLGGDRFREFLAPLEEAGKLHRFDGKSADKMGRERDAVMLRSGPKPVAGTVAGTNGMSTQGMSTQPEAEE